MNQTYAIIVSGVITNLVLWDGVMPFEPIGSLVPANSLAAIGGTFVNGIFTAPIAVLSTPTIVNTPTEAIDALGSLLTPEIAALIAVATGTTTSVTIPTSPGIIQSLMTGIVNLFAP